MRSAVVIVTLSACGFAPAATSDSNRGGGDDGNGIIDALPVVPPSEAAACGWTFAPTNFDPCMLAANPTPLDLTTNLTIDPGASSPIRTTLLQSDGTTIAVFHVTRITVPLGQTLTIAASSSIAGVVFAVEGDATIVGTIVAIAGSNDATHCATAKGAPGSDSTNYLAGAGGGGGGGAADAGGDGTDGAGTNKGVGGGAGKKVGGATSLSPLRGGCQGGAGARVMNSAGSGTTGGRGGGALEISVRGAIILSGEIDANGRGGQAPSVGGDGGAGGGAGGGILLEGPAAMISGRVCSDGGSGGEGGGATSGGNSGVTGACTGSTFATTPDSGSIGGSGGNGSYSGSTKGGSGGAAGNSAQGGGGGGGGGGGVGWIRIHSPAPTTSGVITPAPLVD